ncbi:hypothetical protein GLOIN_2v1801857 [Rhizophagus clarus]|uniref:Uncharacterized protein n=1 Tax=Rhizophagus clarus TaxID=94130 RepID=A0A8H3LIV8_9GLOM|nr:hypothetical protein GLOIN_2v1801857 [Rhizophagus clarus]
MVSSERSASGVVSVFLRKTNRKKSQHSGIHVFGFDIVILHQARIEQFGGSLAVKVVDKRKRPLNEVSISQQNKRFASFSKEAHEKIKQLIVKHQMILSNAKLDAYVRTYDEALLGWDGYRRLAAVEARLVREYQIAQRRIEITKLINNQIQIGVFNLDKDITQQPVLDEDEFQENSDGIVVDE